VEQEMMVVTGAVAEVAVLLLLV